jgi:hypothetical protein
MRRTVEPPDPSGLLLENEIAGRWNITHHSFRAEVPAAWALGYCRHVPDDPSLDGESVRAAEVIATLSLATDLGIGVPLEYGLESTLIAMRVADRLGVDTETAAQTYYACLLFYVGCTANADVAAEIFGADDSLTRYAAPARFGSRPEMVAGFLRAIAPPGSTPLVRARQLAHGLPRIVLVFKEHLAAFCEVADMLSDRLGLPPSVGPLFSHVAERWDGKRQPGQAKHDQIPLPVRITHVARDAAFQRMLGGGEFAARVIGERQVTRSIRTSPQYSWTRRRRSSRPRPRTRRGTKRSLSNHTHGWPWMARQSIER